MLPRYESKKNHRKVVIIGNAYQSNYGWLYTNGIMTLRFDLICKVWFVLGENSPHSPQHTINGPSWKKKYQWLQRAESIRLTLARLPL